MIEERLVTIEEVNHPMAMVRDQRGATFEVPTSILPVRGKLPRAGEQWVVTRDWLSGWRWVGYVDNTGQGGSIYREVVGDGSETVWVVEHGLGTLALIVEVYVLKNGVWEVDHASKDVVTTLLDETRVQVDFLGIAPVVDGAAIVVLSV